MLFENKFGRATYKKRLITACLKSTKVLDNHAHALKRNHPAGAGILPIAVTTINFAHRVFGTEHPSSTKSKQNTVYQTL
ncbi:hypothetical protein DDR33_13060 [Pararcticibacter amylolyticus]|uniref:Uncharacterized protein n=1 Tax=Pararcticibacter amylolyticus TaxID=2173175 RepID=A0A2U2PFE4_9SPHI|nr:hypothetical protein DDR33_13060 [Pararcticibacter amylolyticus]